MYSVAHTQMLESEAKPRGLLSGLADKLCELKIDCLPCDIPEEFRGLPQGKCT